MRFANRSRALNKGLQRFAQIELTDQIETEQRCCAKAITLAPMGGLTLMYGDQQLDLSPQSATQTGGQ
jgi:hypothetical protein